MSTDAISRRKFLTGAIAAAGLAAAPAVSRGTEAHAAASKDIPWAYTVQDPVKLGKRAYEVYYASGCAEATWWPIVEALGKDESNPDRALWAGMPKKLFLYGGGGIAGWGTICGTLNGSSALIRAVGAPNSVVDAVMMYYADTPMPTNAIDNLARAGWVPTAPAPKPRENVPSCIGGTQLCHASISAWTTMTGYKDGGPEQRDRCAKACYDLTHKTVSLLNAWKTSGALPNVALDASVNQCAAKCHSADGVAPQKAKMACDSCHDETMDHWEW